jgi:hypothetical protein
MLDSLDVLPLLERPYPDCSDLITVALLMASSTWLCSVSTALFDMFWTLIYNYLSAATCANVMIDMRSICASSRNRPFSYLTPLSTRFFARSTMPVFMYGLADVFSIAMELLANSGAFSSSFL